MNPQVEFPRPPLRAPISRRSKMIGTVAALLLLAGLGWLAWDLTHPGTGAANAGQSAGPGSSRPSSAASGAPGAALGAAPGTAPSSAVAAASGAGANAASAPAGAGSGAARRGPPPTTVGIAVAERASVPVLLDALGTVTPQAAVRVRPQVAGVLEKVLFAEGQLVRAGQLLATIDPRQFELALQQAQGQRQRDEAQLDSARVMLARLNTLMAQDSIARQDLDSQAALVKQLEGTLLIDKANEGIARLNLGYTKVVAPVSGRIGLRAVDVGNVVSPGDTNGIALITQLTPMDVVFAVPQDQAGSLQKSLLGPGDQASALAAGKPAARADRAANRAANKATSGAAAGRAIDPASSARAQRPAATSIKVTALDRSRTQVLGTGLLASLDNQVDTQTGTVRAKARFANADLALFPSQFVNVQVLIDTVENAVVVPVTAVRRGSTGDFAYVLNAQGRTVSLRPVTRGQATAEKVVITAGLKVGERVITEGADRLKDGASVVLPSDQARPPKTGASAASGARDSARGEGRREEGNRGASSAASSPGDAASRPPRRPPEAGTAAPAAGS